MMLLFITTVFCITASSVMPASYNPAGGYIYGCPFVVCTDNLYTFDSRGCRTCASLSNIGNNPAGNPFQHGGSHFGLLDPYLSSGSQSSSPTYNKPCIPGIQCDKVKCPYGYYTGPGGCQFCFCAKPPATTTAASYTNPCTNAPQTCDLTCDNGYNIGKDGCQFCVCAIQPGMTSHAPTLSPQDRCFAKMTACQLTHPRGFMMDPECNSCVGKDEVYRASNITEERQPKVQLSNPCLQGFDLCMIVCKTGYKTGPRMCQYCACQE